MFTTSPTSRSGGVGESKNKNEKVVETSSSRPPFKSPIQSTFAEHEEKLKSVGLAAKLGVTTLAYPIEYVRTLMQIGHEPLSPIPTNSLIFSRPVLSLPSVFRYIGHVRKQRGVATLYSGIFPKLTSTLVEHVLSERLDSVWPDSNEDIWDKDETISDKDVCDFFVEDVKRKSILRLITVLITHPIHVIQVRVVAQFVGGEEKFSGVLSSIQEVFKQNGLFGFFSGFIPRLIGEISFIILSTSLTCLINRYLLTDPIQKKLTCFFTNYVASSLTYPMIVVSNTAIVSRSGLMAGYPPNMPFYSNWMEVYRHLNSQNQLKRGSSIIFRYFTGPHVVIQGKAVPIN